MEAKENREQIYKLNAIVKGEEVSTPKRPLEEQTNVGTPLKEKVSSKETKQLISNKVFLSIQVKNGVSKQKAMSDFTSNFGQTSYRFSNWRRTLIEPESVLFPSIQSLMVGSTKKWDGESVEIDSSALNDIHFYKLNSDGPLQQELSLNENSDEQTIGSQLWNLPCVEFENIWENLHYSCSLKNELMAYVYSLVNLSQKGVDLNVITVNRMILLLGPPGTGKTSLCRGLAQLLSVRINAIYKRSVMFEINSHSLFSRWFSESGKLVQKMFSQVEETSEDKDCMVFVLIDEVESLGMSRENSSNRGDPADSIRAVNALLTQIDRIRRRPNVLIMCTSNLDKCLDSALMDRMDIVRHVGAPSPAAFYTILSGCVVELQRIGLVEENHVLANLSEVMERNDELSKYLFEICREAVGLSGRAIRQIPALACALSEKNKMTTRECLDHIRTVVLERLQRNKK